MMNPSKNKPEKEWRIENNRVIECIAKDCKERANSHCLCWKHYDEEYPREENFND